MPLILMLVAGAAACGITFFQEYTMFERLLIIFIVLLVFYILGSIMKATLNYFDGLNEKRDIEEGEVIEKESEELPEEQAQGEKKSE